MIFLGLILEPTVCTTEISRQKLSHPWKMRTNLSLAIYISFHSLMIINYCFMYHELKCVLGIFVRSVLNESWQFDIFS